MLGLNAASTTITTTGAGAHGISLNGGAQRTFDSTADNALPTITVSGNGAAALAASGAGSLITIDGATSLHTSMATGAESWGAKAEHGGALLIKSNSRTGGVGLWADAGTVTLRGNVDATGSRVRVDGEAGMLLVEQSDSTGLGSLEGNGLVRFLVPGSFLYLGMPNEAGGSSLRDGADFAGRFANVGFLGKNGPTTQVLSGTGNTVDRVQVNGGTLAFTQDGAFNVRGTYRTEAGATTVVASNAMLDIGGSFTQVAGATLNVTADDTAEIVADSARLAGRLVVNGLGGNGRGKASEVLAAGTNMYTVIQTRNGIEGDFDTTDSHDAYVLTKGFLSDDGLSYQIRDLRLAWTDGGAESGHGLFSMVSGSTFEIDVALSDQAVPPDGMASGWDGRSLTKRGEGTLGISMAQAYTGETLLEGGMLRTHVDDAFAASEAITVNGGTLDLDGNDQRATNFSGTGGQVLLNGAMLTTDTTIDTTFAGDVMDGAVHGGGLTKTGAGMLTIGGATGWSGATLLSEGALVLDGAAAQLTSDVTGNAGTTLTLRNGASLSGMVLAGTVARNAGAMDFDVESGSTWTPTGDSVVGTLTLAGDIVPNTPDPGRTAGWMLTAHDWVGQGGSVTLFTEMAGDASLSDQLVIDGGSASGNTDLIIRRTGGAGAQTQVGIPLVRAINGGTTATDAFALGATSDGYRPGFGTLTAGGYEYRLARGGNAGNAEDWYLVSALASAEGPVEPPQQPTDLVRSPETDTYLGNAQLSTRAVVRTHRDRRGQFDGADEPVGWILLEGLQAHQDDPHGLEQRSGGLLVHAGSDVFRKDAGEGRFQVGVLGQYADLSNTSTRPLFNALTGEMAPVSVKGTTKGYSAGVYAAWQGNTTRMGPRVDSWATTGRFDNTVGGSLATDSYTSRTTAASLEGGYAFALHEGERSQWSLEPQLQAVYVNHRADAHLAPVGAIDGQRSSGVVGRAGLRLEGVTSLQSGGAMRPFVEANYWRAPDELALTIDGNRFLPAGENDWMELRVGQQGQLTERVSVFGAVGVESDFADYRAVGGNVGLQVRW